MSSPTALSEPLSPDVPEVLESIGRVVWVLAWPAVALNSLQVLNMLLDRFFIGHLAVSSLTAHGASTSVMFLMFQLAVALATGVTALVARHYGADERTEYRRAAREGLSVAVVGGLLVAAFTALTARLWAAGVLPATDLAANVKMTNFLIVYSTSLPAIFVIQVLAGALRGVGDTRSSMMISGIQIAFHMTLNCLLVFPQIGPIRGAGWGLMGTASALSISGWISAIIYVCYAVRTPLGPVWTWRPPHREYVQRILRIAMPQALNGLLRVSSLTAFTIVLSLVPRGSDAIAAMSIAFSIESIMIMPGFGLAAAAGALVGQSLGMGKPDRAEKIGWTAAWHGAVVTMLLAIIVFQIAKPIAGVLLGNKPEIIAISAQLLRILAFTEIGFAFAMILFGAMQGAGDTRRPLWVSMVALWGIRVPMAFMLSLHAGQPLTHAFGHLISMPVAAGLGALGAWFSMSFTQGVQGILAYAVYRQGRWKAMRV